MFIVQTRGRMETQADRLLDLAVCVHKEFNQCYVQYQIKIITKIIDKIVKNRYTNVSESRSNNIDWIG